MAGSNRGRLRCEPLIQDRVMPPGLLTGIPARLEPLAYLYFAAGRSMPEAILVRVQATGVLCAWRWGVLGTVDQRKATKALERMKWIMQNGRVEADEDAAPHES